MVDSLLTPLKNYSLSSETLLSPSPSLSCPSLSCPSLSCPPAPSPLHFDVTSIAFEVLREEALPEKNWSVPTPSILPPQPRMVVPVVLQLGGIPLEVKALVDSGSDETFINSELASRYGLATMKLEVPIAITLADGLPASTPFITHRTTLLQLSVGIHLETTTFYVYPIGHSVILGLDWLQRHNPDVNWPSLSLSFCSEYCLSNCLPTDPLAHEIPYLNIHSLETEKVSASVYPFISNDTVESPLCSEAKTLILDFPEVFDESRSERLPENGPHDFPIDLVPGFKPPHGKIYSLTPKERLAMKEYIQDSLNKGHIRPSSSPSAAPCFFVEKSNGSLRPVQDYRGLNSGVVKNRYPLPLIPEMLRTLAKGNFFTLLDQKNAYNQIRIRSGDEWKAAFVCPEGQFEPLIMGFGHANAVAHYQSFISGIFSDLIGVYVLVYLDDLIIFSETRAAHQIHVREVLGRLSASRLTCGLPKCYFFQESLRYLGYIVSRTGISMDPKKIVTIMDWPTPKNLKELQSFLGFTNFYRRFISDYAKQTLPLTSLLKKSVSFIWSSSLDDTFAAFKSSFSNSVVLGHVDESIEFIVEVDASDYAIGGVLSQSIQGINRPVAFFSRQMIPAERNYEIYDKELLAIVTCLKEWRHFLQNSTLPFLVLSDHKNLQYFMTTKQLTRRQARWSLFMADFSFTIQYRPGSYNGRADLLSRRADYFMETDTNNLKRLLDPATVVSSLNNLQLSLVNRSVFSPTLNRYIFFNRDWPLIIADYLSSNTNTWLVVPDFLLERCNTRLAEFAFMDDAFVHTNLGSLEKIPYLPSWERTKTYKRFHDGLGHLKFDSVFDLLSRRHWWDSMKQDLKEYIRTCPSCQLDASNTSNFAPTPIRPVPPVAHPFVRWGIDFIQDLPETKSGNRNIITAICYATRWVVATATKDRDSTTVGHFLYDLMMNYGAPNEIFSDRGSALISEGLKAFEKLQKIRHFASTPYHPQTNGVVERMHAMVGHAITTLSSGNPTRWDEYLAQTVFAIRVRQHAVTKKSPFFLLYGVEPRLPGDLSPIITNMAPLDDIELLEAEAESTARKLETLGNARGAAYARSKAQAEAMRLRNKWDPDSDEYYFKIGDMVKMKNYSSKKFEFEWKGPYHVVDVGHPGTYWIMKPDGQRLDSTVNETSLAPWLHRLEPDQEFLP